MEIAILLFIWLIIYEVFYSPKGRIRQLRRAIYRIPIKIARLKRKMPDEAKHFDEMCEKALNARYKMINALLDFHFDPDEDREYIKEIRLTMPFDFR
ncbi:hypothetical protein A3B21_01590 [Candidatus Uhrbacteria bacterium RIFCSPLOWO2_01_FULL_47_24]|uniref:Uncharacterized protein n=1 Tax=Candidatus Uhrbacteria bacterium RIFCSPLOWO2_01_FULL_47_24 TaxID=1802401 RepID=A0A1F7US07_9BACT|nr:MAG: hypothetical protein A2753_04690 [Candidatus Uhrbacteria bacterium RIFCSPHIGHO2_01_FULL_47_11]OGL68679.1 MAG: hypothetical protein A3D58_02100 [Candidatus Uhrbacteria bacterium RIFCSPHIGHO2_02_FULL_46_47]OGL74976.1 MAG: hypothetical protein A3F52_03220 [Candidatus Uhrbacteria bacterium RIFCSPHIGHO2_12_FULL_47_11]OGL81071.1 MAG: hypothetical protein A3B21_01590 [Candidatus Uhrbacteria bacterium RIFCSPLOWO2_01_FULL_47_24]OGL84590.1 MAG: hypothetical protein A3J03_02185 [Candidatus Uhrbact